MAKKALFVVGGWEGHTPFESAELFAELLRQAGYEVEIADTLDVYVDVERLAELDLIVPTWTMDVIRPEQLAGLLTAVRQGVGVGGWHGCMGDSFRDAVDMAQGIAADEMHRVNGELALHVLEGMAAFGRSAVERRYVELGSRPERPEPLGGMKG